MFVKSRDIKKAKLMMYLIPSAQKRTEWLKKNKVFFSMGENCYYHTKDIPAEPYLLSLHDNVRVAANVRFITHDMIGVMVNKIDGFKQKYGRMKYYIGSIEVYENVMIGADSTIMYDVKIGPNAIIGKFEDFVIKRNKKTEQRPEKTDGIDKVIEYFWKNQSEE